MYLLSFQAALPPEIHVADCVPDLPDHEKKSLAESSDSVKDDYSSIAVPP